MSPAQGFTEILPDFTCFKIIGWGWMYLSTVFDAFSRYIIAWKLCTAMRAEDLTDTLDRALRRIAAVAAASLPLPIAWVTSAAKWSGTHEPSFASRAADLGQVQGRPELNQNLYLMPNSMVRGRPGNSSGTDTVSNARTEAIYCLLNRLRTEALISQPFQL